MLKSYILPFTIHSTQFHRYCHWCLPVEAAIDTLIYSAVVRQALMGVRKHEQTVVVVRAPDYRIAFDYKLCLL